MALLAWIVLFSLIGGALSVLAAAILLLLPEHARSRLVPHLVSFAIGVLLGAAFLALLPHAVAAPLDAHVVGAAVLFGLLGFFLLEKMVLWRHCHSDACEAHTPYEAYEHGRDRSTVSLILIGDGLHNLVDGVLIAGAFLTDFHLGVVTSLAVAAHEVPQELGDFAILLHSGLGRLPALGLNMLSGLTSVVGAVVGYFSLRASVTIVPYVLAVAAASFIYIAVADLIPGLHRRLHPRATFQQVGLIALGVVVIYGAHSALH